MPNPGYKKTAFFANAVFAGGFKAGLSDCSKKFKIRRPFQNGEMQGSEKIQGALSCADARSGFFR